MKALLFLFLFFSALWGTAIQGGNISLTNVVLEQNSSWHGVCGQVLPAPISPLVINATAGTVDCINLGIGSCANGFSYVNLLLSNSSAAIASLHPGNLSQLDNFINSQNQNGTQTFLSLSSFQTSAFGTIPSVPTTFTASTPMNAFRMGYLNDQSGNLVIISPLNLGGASGFNGSSFNFQFMLPTMNATSTVYYLITDVKCSTSPPPPPPPPGPGGFGGGGSGTPYYNSSSNSSNVSKPIPPPIVPPVPVPPRNVTCTPSFSCGEWSGCVDGFRQQSCQDQSGCSLIPTFNVEQCPPVPSKITIPPVLPARVEGGFPYLCLLPLLILLLLLWLWLRRWTLYYERGFLNADSIAIPPKIMKDLGLNPGDTVRLSFGGKTTIANVVQSPKVLLDKDSPAKGRGRHILLGDMAVWNLKVKFDGERDTKGKGFEKYKNIIWLKLKKVGREKV